ncbi:MAG: hypothetical protein UHX00_08570 [Caryophanon sp.]|nr:hypothetical protein [Caryophanon sp.]
MDWNSLSKEQLQNFLQQNLIDKHAARKITGQSVTAFNQAVLRGKIVPIVKYGNGRGGMNLFLREDIELYKQNMKITTQGGNTK